jgi:ketosteroid isomerase-like protein
MTEPTDIPAPVAELIRRAAEGNDAFMNGDMQRWLSLIPHSGDFSLMAPFGGWTSGDYDDSPERLDAMARHFKSATTAFEVVATHASADMIVLAAVERQRGVVGDLPEQDWSLRVTLVYCRTATGWDLVHRHADPLVGKITGDQLSVIAKGEVPARQPQA